MLYGLLAQMLPKKAHVNGVGTFVYLLFTLTSGFVVYPSAIPSYWKWLFYVNPMAWAQQGLASNQFLSSVYSGYSCVQDGYILNLGDSGLAYPRGWHLGTEWIGYSFAFLLAYILVFALASWLALKYIRIEPDRPHVKEVHIGTKKKTDEFSIPFQAVDLSFDNLIYEVTASTSNDNLRLLNKVSGVFKAGRMCALMGSSGGEL